MKTCQQTTFTEEILNGKLHFFYAVLFLQGLTHLMPQGSLYPLKKIKKALVFRCFQWLQKETSGKACNLIKIQTLAQVFSYEFCEISKNTFLQNSSGGCFSVA